MRLCMVGNTRSEHVLRWVRHFVARGHEVHTASVWDAELGGITHHRVGRGARPLPRRLLSYLALPKALGPLFERIRPDVVQAHFAYTYGAAVAATGFHPVMLVAMGSDVLLPRWWERVLRPLSRKALRHADTVVCASAGKVLATHRLGATCPIYQLPHGVHLERFAPRSEERPAGPFRIGIFKPLRALYGHRDLLDAFALVAKKHPDAELVIAGDGPLQGKLEEQAAALGIAPNVQFLGPLPHEDVPTTMAGLDAVVLASYSEGLPNMVLEAFAMGLPAVATGVGGVPEVVKHGRTGHLVPASDPWTLAEAICRLIEDPAGRRRMGQAARALVEAEYDCRKNLAEMESVCQALARHGAETRRR